MLYSSSQPHYWIIFRRKVGTLAFSNVVEMYSSLSWLVALNWSLPLYIEKMRIKIYLSSISGIDYQGQFVKLASCTI